MTYTFYADPGHAWLAVPVTDLASVGLTRQDFSEYSYIKGDVVYLEEDCDAFKFWEAYTATHGKAPVCREEHSNYDSIIRTYKRIK